MGIWAQGGVTRLLHVGLRTEPTACPLPHLLWLTSIHSLLNVLTCLQNYQVATYSPLPGKETEDGHGPAFPQTSGQLSEAFVCVSHVKSLVSPILETFTFPQDVFSLPQCCVVHVQCCVVVME